MKTVERQKKMGKVFPFLWSVMLLGWATGAFAQGFGSSDETRRQAKEEERLRLAAEVGKVYWLNFSERASQCGGLISSVPTTSGRVIFYKSPVPVSVEIIDVVPSDGISNQYWYKLRLNDNDIGYVEPYRFKPEQGEIDEFDLRLRCIFPKDPKQLLAEARERKARVEQASAEEAAREERRAQLQRQASSRQARKPGATIGMTAAQVVSETNWGRPRSVNRTTTAAGTREQWVYGPSNYLYFENGVLTAIQN